MAAPGVSSVVTRKPDGTQPRHLGTLGHVAALTYSWSNPGGPDQLSCVLQVPPDFRTDALNPGRQCQVIRGGRTIWDGKLMEPAPTAAGWQVTAVGIGKAGADFTAVYTTWTNQNDAVNQAITRGLRWVNPGIPAGVFTGQASDSASLTITDLLNLFCTAGGYTWYVNVTPAGNSLSVYLFPSATLASVNRVLVTSAPVARTLGGDVNTVYIRYQTSADTATAATFALTSVTNATATALHGNMEVYADVSSAGTLTAGAAQALAQSVLNRYQRASYAGSFSVAPGQFLNAGGVPVDLGLDHTGTIVRPVIADWGAGGEVVPDPAVFMAGAWSYDQDAGTAQCTPFQSLSQSVSGMLSARTTVLSWAATVEAALDARQAAAAAAAAAEAAQDRAEVRRRSRTGTRLTPKSTITFPYFPPPRPRRVPPGGPGWQSPRPRRRG